MMFERALQTVLFYEGGYVNHPDDPGGETNKGVTQKVYDSWRTYKNLETRSVRFITNEEVEAIYRDNYWIPSRADDLPIGVNLVHFDFAVNAGLRRAAITLQRCVSVSVDGIIGPITLGAVNALEPAELVSRYSEARRQFYNNLANTRPKLKTFLRGWLNRTAKCERRALAAIRRATPDREPN